LNHLIQSSDASNKKQQTQVTDFEAKGQKRIKGMKIKIIREFSHLKSQKLFFDKSLNLCLLRIIVKN